MGSEDIKKRKIKRNREMKNNRKLNRRVQNRFTIPKILVLTEGFSEKIYFKCLQNELKLNTVEVVKSNYTDAFGIVNEAVDYGEKSIREKNEYNYIFCVFDLDTVSNKQFISIIRSYNNKYKNEDSIIYPIITYPCIEFWFILHYHCHDAPFSKKQKYSISDIAKTQFKNYHNDYFETNQNSIARLIPYYKTAVSNAEIIANSQINSNSFNPITNIHQLVSLLDNIYCRNSKSKYKYIESIDSYIISKIK